MAYLVRLQLVRYSFLSDALSRLTRNPNCHEPYWKQLRLQFIACLVHQGQAPRYAVGDAIAEWLACWTFDPAVGVPVPLTAGGRVATVG